MAFRQFVCFTFIATLVFTTSTGCTSLRDVPPQQIRVAVGDEIKVETKAGEVVNLTVTETGDEAVSGRKCSTCEVQDIAYADMASLEIREFSTVKTTAAAAGTYYVVISLFVVGLIVGLLGG